MIGTFRLIIEFTMLRYNEQSLKENTISDTTFLDLYTPVTNSIEEDLLGQYFWAQDSHSLDFGFGDCLVDGSNVCDPLSFLTSRGTTTMSSNSSETDSADEASDMEKSHKLTEATRDTFNYQPTFEPPTHCKHQVIEREIFLASKLKKRAPRRSFDLGELQSNQELVFQEDEPAISAISSSNMCVDKEKLTTLYNKMVDEGFCSPLSAKGLNSTEIQILDTMLRIRLVLTKAVEDQQSKPLTSNIDQLNQLLNKTNCLKKRSEELLKKNFKTTLKLMLDSEKKKLPKNTSATQARKLFTEKYFGSKAREYDRIFKCIQMSQDYYTKIFEFRTFKEDFSNALERFMNQFLDDRVSKTVNLITQIKSDLLSGKEIKMNLRTPWSIKEAESSMKLMAQFL